MNTRQLFEHGDHLFSKRQSLMSYWQEVGENFYPERADFTVQRTIGTDPHMLYSSYPIMARRDLGNTLGSMLRPTAKAWFHTSTADEDRLDVEGRRWLEMAEATQRRAMYDRPTQFVRACKEGDHDFAAFGQCVISVETVRGRERVGPHLLYRTWHLRDVVWGENQHGSIGHIFRKWKPTARQLTGLFPSTADEKVRKAAEKEPFREFDCRHMVVESDMFDGDSKGMPYVSIYYDVENDKEMEAVGIRTMHYVVPRWQTVSGSQYAYSPATIAALPDARLIQAMTLTLLEAGEKITNPPMIGVAEALRSDIQIIPGGFTAVDIDYDERTGEALRPMKLDVGGIPLGVEMQRDCRAMIAEAFYLTKFSMPDRGRAEMTAFEVGQRVQEYIRQALPIFEPMETEYNGAICDRTFDLLLHEGAFGSMHDMPPSLRGATVQFRFESPLHDAIGSELSHKLLETKQMLAGIIDLDPTAAQVLDAKTALRQAMLAARVPAAWQRSEEELQAMEMQAQAAQQAQTLLGTMQQGADVVKTLGDANKAFAPA